MQYYTLKHKISVLLENFKQRIIIKRSLPQTRSYKLNDYEANKRLKLATNYIQTTKYNIWNFIPLCCLNQFRRVANLYFLLITVIQFIPLISTLDPWTGCLPLLTVLVLSMLREAFEDYLRY